jgi:hypothetical protein
MKSFFCSLFFIITFSSCICFGQEKTPIVATKWTRIETEDKELSVSFPSDFLVDAKTDVSDQRRRIIGFENGVVMELKTYKPDDPQKRLGIMFSNTFGDSQLTSFNFENFTGKNFVVSKTRYLNTISLASKENFYTLSITAQNQNKPEISRFLYSIRLNGKPLFNKKAPQSETTDGLVSLSSLETSQKVLEAFNRRTEDTNGNITYELNQTEGSDETELDSSKKPAIILLNAPPKPDKIFKGDRVYGISVINLKATLLANGQIGDIAVLSASKKFNYKSFIEALKQIKFIPAEINGIPVNSERVFRYQVQASRQ